MKNVLEKQKITVFPDSNLKKQGEKIQTRELEQKNNIPPLLPDKNIFSYSGFLAAFVLGAIGSYLIFRPKKEKQIQKQKIDIDTLCTNAGQNDLKKFRDDLIFWAQREYPQNSIKNLEDISKTLQCPELNEYFKKFSVVLYGKDQLVSFDTKKMVKVLKKAVKDYKKNRQNKKTPLPPLYQ